jgi:uncharacterized LabA/DUF88 family protein
MVNLRIAIFVDGANFFHMQRKELRWMVDLKKLIDYFEQLGTVVDAYYYTGIKYPISEKQHLFLNSLPDLGYVLVSKPLKEINDDGFPKYKANLDVEIVLDIFNTIDSYDCAVLVSGDSDFERALQLLRARGKQFYVLSTYNNVSREIRAVAGKHYIEIRSIENFVKLYDISEKYYSRIPDQYQYFLEQNE